MDQYGGMSHPFPELVIGYIGPNAAHRAFSRDIGNLKVFTYAFQTGKDGLFGKIEAAIAEAKTHLSHPDAPFAIGMAGGRSTTTSVQMAIHLPRNALEFVAAHRQEFTEQILALVYREAYRVFETFTLDLFESIAILDPTILPPMIAASLKLGSEAHRLAIAQHRADMSFGGLERIRAEFSRFGLPFLPGTEPPPIAEQEDIIRRLTLCAQLRNVIEHNGGVIDDRFLRKVAQGPYQLGEKAVITLTELGDALSAIEWVSKDLNVRAVARFGLT